MFDIEERLDVLLGKEALLNPSLSRSASYATCNGGKRIRAKMILQITGSKGIDLASAIECIHSYSLIHDDLPCMDNAAIRRGRASTHIAFGEASAILTGDFLLTYAFELLANLKIPAAVRCEIIKVVSKQVGASGMLGGQIEDIATKNKAVSWPEYQKIVLQKTAALFAASLETAAIFKRFSLEERAVYKEFGNTFGLIYQIRDDLKDNDIPPLSPFLEKEEILKVLDLLILHAEHLVKQFKTPHNFFFDCIDSLKTTSLL